MRLTCQVSRQTDKYSDVYWQWTLCVQTLRNKRRWGSSSELIKTHSLSKNVAITAEEGDNSWVTTFGYCRHLPHCLLIALKPFHSPRSADHLWQSLADFQKHYGRNLRWSFHSNSSFSTTFFRSNFSMHAGLCESNHGICIQRCAQLLKRLVVEWGVLHSLGSIEKLWCGIFGSTVNKYQFASTKNWRFSSTTKKLPGYKGNDTRAMYSGSAHVYSVSKNHFQPRSQGILDQGSVSVFGNSTIFPPH